MTTLVSIIIPAYNAERWIAATVQSALAQDWENKEIIIVDDGSTDQTLAVMKLFESRIVKVISQPNKGASAARNAGLTIAQGDYIQWLDADDLLAHDKISTQIRVADEGIGNRVLLSGLCSEFSVDPSETRPKFSPLSQDLQPIDFFLKRFNENLWLGNCVWLVSRHLTELCGPWDERLSLDDDGEYFSRLVASSESIRFVPHALSFYRRSNPGSLSRSFSNRACESQLLSLRLCIRYLLSLEDSERTRSAALTFLQTWINMGECFYPDKKELFEEIRALGSGLGGALSPPHISWKYLPIKAFGGWSSVRKARTYVANIKVVARVLYDAFMYTHRSRKR